jgi:hypothetical protein
MLARAYGVPRDLSAVSATIYERIFGPMEITLSVSTLDGIPAEWNAIETIVGMLVLNRQDFARVRGGGRPSKPSRKSMAEMVAVYVPSSEAEAFVERVMGEIASTLASDRSV